MMLRKAYPIKFGAQSSFMQHSAVNENQVAFPIDFEISSLKQHSFLFFVLNCCALFELHFGTYLE